MILAYPGNNNEGGVSAEANQQGAKEICSAQYTADNVNPVLLQENLDQIHDLASLGDWQAFQKGKCFLRPAPL